MNRSYTKIRHIQESNLLLEKRLLSEKTPVTTNTTTTPPIAKPTQTYSQKVLTKGDLGNYPATDITMSITPQGKGQYKIIINNSIDSGKIVSGGLYPTLDYRVLIKQMPGIFGDVTGSDLNELNSEMKKKITKIVLGLPKA